MRASQFCFLIFLVVSSVSAIAETGKFIELGESHKKGREIWMGTCVNCHGYGIAGAPIPMLPKDWAQRVKAPMDQHYSNAINGFFGKDDTYMPPRGGNDQLSNTEVILAVDYMLALALYYINLKDNKQ